MSQRDNEESAPAWCRGIVEQVSGHRVKVRLPDMDDMVTDWLPVSQCGTLGAKGWVMPRSKAQVVVLLDENMEDGVVLGGIYSDADPAPAVPAEAWHFELEDGTSVTVASGKVTVNTPGDLEATAGGTATVTAPTINLKGNVNIDGNLTTSGDATIGGKSFLGHQHRAQGSTAITTAPL